MPRAKPIEPGRRADRSPEPFGARKSGAGSCAPAHDFAAHHARTKLGLPRRDFGGKVHYSAPFDTEGALCGARGRQVAQTRCRKPADCPRCLEITDWIWGHLRPRRS